MKHLLAPFVAILLLSSCSSYNKLVRKYGRNVTDTLRVVVSDTVRIEKDSLVLGYRNDTVAFRQVMQQGRARVIVEKTPIYTTIQAECRDTTIIHETIKEIPVTKRVFGVDPKLLEAANNRADSWMYGCIVLGGLLTIGLIVWLVTRLFDIKVTRKRKGTDPA